MPTPAVTLKLRRFRRRFGIAAPRVVVRSHLPWPWLAGAVALLLLVVVGGVWSVMQHNEAGAMGRDLDNLRREFQAQREELNLLRSTAGTEQSAVHMERAAQQKLLSRVQGLERENASLKEDILLFERLIPVLGEEAAVRIENFRLVAEGRGRYRYRLLLAFQPSRQAPDFHGRLQLAVAYSLAGHEQQRLLPDKPEAGADYLVDLKHFQRREGVIELPPDAAIKSIEARILLGDTLKAKRMAQL
ncbi:MAG: DUF6776 family protein [Bacteroidota bacterium]